MARTSGKKGKEATREKKLYLLNKKTKQENKYAKKTKQQRKNKNKNKKR